MDDAIKRTIASNLTAAYCANHREPLSVEAIVEIYHRFVKSLAPTPGGAPKGEPDLKILPH